MDLLVSDVLVLAELAGDLSAVLFAALLSSALDDMDLDLDFVSLIALFVVAGLDQERPSADEIHNGGEQFKTLVRP